MKYLFGVVSLIIISMPVQAETVYLLIKSYTQYGGGLALHSLPMESLEQCEEMGAVVIASERLDTKFAKEDGFECIEGK